MSTERAQEIGERIRQCREALHLTQEELARRTTGASITGNVISRWERGRNKPSPSSVEELADALDVESSYLLFGNQRPKSAAAALDQTALVERISALEDRLAPLETIEHHLAVLAGAFSQSGSLSDLVAATLEQLDGRDLPHSVDADQQRTPPAQPSRARRRRAAG